MADSSDEAVTGGKVSPGIMLLLLMCTTFTVCMLYTWS